MAFPCSLKYPYKRTISAPAGMGLSIASKVSLTASSGGVSNLLAASGVATSAAAAAAMGMQTQQQSGSNQTMTGVGLGGGGQGQQQGLSLQQQQQLHNPYTRQQSVPLMMRGRHGTGASR